MKIRPTRAIISVYNKEGIVEFSRRLAELGVEIISTGGTAARLREDGLEIKEVSTETGFPEIFSGRVKSLHPVIHGGILARRDLPQDREELEENGIVPIDLVVVNLYPFQDTLKQNSKEIADYVEMIDIGGPTLIRAAAKNFKYVTVVTEPADYGLIIEQLAEEGGIELATRLELAAKAFQGTAEYDVMIGDFLSTRAFCEDDEDGEKTLRIKDKELFPGTILQKLQKVRNLRYGENPHQQAAFYRADRKKDVHDKYGKETRLSEEVIAFDREVADEVSAGLPRDLTNARQLAGKGLSFNNINDLNGAVQQIREFIKPAVSIVKHTNPCGIGEDDNLTDAFLKALSSDPVSAYGSIIALNRPVNETIACVIADKATFVEVIAAPAYEEEAVEVLNKRWKNLRILVLPEINNPQERLQFKEVAGGFLVQEVDSIQKRRDNWEIVTSYRPDEKMLEDLAFAWKVVKNVKSNAIVIARDGGTVGVGAGQMSRVDACKIAVEKAGERTRGAVAASDAFFPFPDALETLAENGVQAIIQPGGSIRDEEVIQRADELGLVMVFTGERHFLH